MSNGTRITLKREPRKKKQKFSNCVKLSSFSLSLLLSSLFSPQSHALCMARFSPSGLNFSSKNKKGEVEERKEGGGGKKGEEGKGKRKGEENSVETCLGCSQTAQI
jgi:hypothetical protein